MTGVVLSPLVPMWLIYLLLALAAGLIVYGIMRQARGVLLRALPVAALIFAIADPRLVQETHSPLKDVAIVVVDDSDSQKLGQRAETTEKALAALSKELEGTPDLEVRTIRAGRTDANGREDGTQLFAALTLAMSDIPANRLAGAVVITDGQIHDALPADRAAQIHAPYLAAPLHVLLSGEHREFDRRIRVESAADFGFVGQSASVRLRADDTSAAAGALLPVTIRRNNEPPRDVVLPNGQTLEVPIPISAAGANVFDVEVTAAPGELTTANNHAMVSINGVRDRLKVLLISGQPHVGERSWRNLLKADPNVDLVHFTILRPLEKDDGTPLSELALISFPMRELFEEKLKEFDLIIFDRYNQKGLIPGQYMSNIASYVRNGGALMLAVGPEYADNYSLFTGAFQSILPGQPTGRIYSGTFRPHVSATGQRHPVTQMLEQNFPQAGGQPTWGQWLRQVQVARPLGDAVMTGQDNEPLLLLNHVGGGRVALLLSDTLWLWGKGFDGGGPQVELMRRISHWLMKEPDLEEEALTAQARDGVLSIARHSLSAEEVPVTITTPSGSEQTALAKDTGKGTFAAQVPITETGVYHLSDGKNSALAPVDAPNPREAYDVVATADRVTPLVEATGGGVYWLADGSLPSIRRTGPSTRIAHGASWMGLKANAQYVVTGTSQYPLAPLAIIVLLIMAGAMLAWWREGH